MKRRGFVNDSGVTVNVNSAKALNSVVGHEIVHVLESDTKLYDGLKTTLAAYAKTKGEYNSRLEQLTKLYEGKEGYTGADAAAKIERELVADLVGDYLFTDKDFVRQLSTENRNVFQRIYDQIKYLCKVATVGSKEARQLEKAKKLFQEIYREGAKNPTGEGGTKYAISQAGTTNTQSQYAYMKSFADQIADYQKGNIIGDDALVIGPTPDVLKKIGLVELPMTINQKHVGDALNGTYKGTQQEKLDHTFTAQELATLPEKLADPVAIIYDKRTGKTNASESNIDVLVEMTVASGKQVLAAIQVNGNGRINGIRIDTNKVSTVHGNTDSISRLIEAINENEKGNVAVFYLNKDKTTKALQRTGNPIPSGLSNLDGFIHSITDFGSPVKMRISSVTESQQFKRWFGDWQNHPENASKVVNADGTPKVVYHGTGTDFSIFDKRKAKEGAFGRGFYFAATKGRAQAYSSGKIMETYLSIKAPYIVRDSMGFTGEDYQNMQKEFGLQDGITDKNVGKILQKQGYDGIMVYDGNGNVKEIIAFEPTQIKSATDNVGTFDGGNPDVRYSLSTQDQAETRGQGWLVRGQDVALEQEGPGFPLPPGYQEETSVAGSTQKGSKPEQTARELDADYRRQAGLEEEPSLYDTDEDEGVETTRDKLEVKRQNLRWELQEKQRGKEAALMVVLR